MDQMQPSAVPGKTRTLRTVLTALGSAFCAFAAVALVREALFLWGITLSASVTVLSVFCALASAGLVAYGTLSRRTPLWWLAPLLGYAVSVPVFGFSLYSLPLVLLILLGALTSELVLFARQKRLFCTVVLTALALVAFAAVFFLYVYQRTGALDPDYITSVLRLRVQAYVDGMFAQLREAGGEVLLESEPILFDPDTLRQISATMLLSLPGLVLAALFSAAYLSLAVLRRLMHISGELAILYPDGFLPRPTLVSAILYAACALFSALFGEALPLPLLATLSNLSVILEAVFCFTGISELILRSRRRRLRTGRGHFPVFWILLVLLVVSSQMRAAGGIASLVVPLCMLALLFIPLFAVFGLVFTVSRCIREKKSAS